MSKISIIRFSGQPVSPKHLKAYTEEFQAEYDKILAEHSPDMLVVQQHLADLDKVLEKKYEITSYVNMPTSAKAWKALVDYYQAPLMLASSAENPKKLVLVIMDQPLG